MATKKNSFTNSYTINNVSSGSDQRVKNIDQSPVILTVKGIAGLKRCPVA